MAYYECIYNNDHINIGDSFIVNLSGSHNQLTTATVCYIDKGDKTTICLLGDTNLENANWSTQCNYVWNYNISINGKEYTGTCMIPTVKQIYSKCAGYRRDFTYWTSTLFDTYTSYDVRPDGSVHSDSYNLTNGTLPFIEITL